MSVSGGGNEGQCVLLIRDELVELQEIIPMTKAGQELKYTLAEIMAHQEEVLADSMESKEEVAAVRAQVTKVSEQLKDPPRHVSCCSTLEWLNLRCKSGLHNDLYSTQYSALFSCMPIRCVECA